MRIKFITLISLSILFLAMKSDKPAYQYFTKEGKTIEYSKVIKACEKADIIFIGELHNNPISHWMEYEITKDIYAQRDSSVVLGAEMFEADNQIIMNEYFSGKIKKKSFKSEMRLWPNYDTDYEPLLEFANEKKIPFIATNVPRRYASLVNKSGLEALNELSDEAKKFIAPLPIAFDGTLKIYKEMMDMMKSSGMSHVTDNIVKAQAIKDATMAHFILTNLPKEGGAFIHYNGAYHSQDFQGIVWYLKQAKPELNIITISAVEQDSIAELEEEYINQADFLMAVPTSMTKTY